MAEDALTWLRQTSDPKTKKEITQAKCFVCSRWFQFGEGVYDGRTVPEYHMRICDACDKLCKDGFTTEDAMRIEGYLRTRGIPFSSRNAKGWLPLPRA